METLPYSKQSIEDNKRYFTEIIESDEVGRVLF